MPKIDNSAMTVTVNCRLGFPRLFTPEAFDKSKPETAKYGCIAMIPKSDEATHAKVKEAMNAAYRAEWPEKGPKLAPDKVCLSDGADKDNEINHGYWLISASSKRRPPVVNRRREPVQESDGLVYGGAEAIAVLRFWAQDNDYGKRLNCSVEAVQVLGTGDPFGAPPVDPNEAFSVIDGETGGEAGSGWG